MPHYFYVAAYCQTAGWKRASKHFSCSQRQIWIFFNMMGNQKIHSPLLLSYNDFKLVLVMNITSSWLHARMPHPLWWESIVSQHIASIQKMSHWREKFSCTPSVLAAHDHEFQGSQPTTRASPSLWRCVNDNHLTPTTT